VSVCDCVCACVRACAGMNARVRAYVTPCTQGVQKFLLALWMLGRCCMVAPLGENPCLPGVAMEGTRVVVHTCQGWLHCAGVWATRVLLCACLCRILEARDDLLAVGLLQHAACVAPHGPAAATGSDGKVWGW
jgi:hypothetical protein